MTGQFHAQDIVEMHRMAEMVRHLDVGLVVLDRDHRIQFWNTFMENHSGLRSHKALGRNLFELFPGIPNDWFRRKLDSVFLLNHRTFTIWEQRPCLFTFRNFRPITGAAEFMYQNTIITPLASLDGSVDHAVVMIYDVSDAAVSKQALTQLNAQLETQSRTDRLTGLNNRGHWEERVVQEFRRYGRTGQRTALVMFDIDHFKRVNDTFGHQAGDEVIRATAKTLTATLRDTDIAGRYGGEEFGVVLVNADGGAARHFAERFRKSIELQPVRHEANDIRYTISLGVAELDGDVSGYEQWIERADRALYQSKQDGRNRTTVFGRDDRSPVARQH